MGRGSTMNNVNKLKAIRRRNAARWIGIGGVLICLVAAVIWLVIQNVNQIPLEPMVVNGVNLVLPQDVIILIAIAVICAIIGLIFAARASHYFKLARRDAIAEEPDFAEDNEVAAEEDNAYIEEDLKPIEVVSEDLPAEVSAAAEAKEEAGKEPGLFGKACAFVKMKAEEKIPEKHMEKIRKVADTVKKNKNVIVPAVSTIAATTVLVKVIVAKKHAANRKAFYKWLG